MKAVRLFAALAMIGAATPADARTVTFAIPAGSLIAGLNAFSRETAIQVMADPAVLHGRETRGVRGTMAPDQAMRALLAGTGLDFRRRGAVFLIVEGPRARAAPRRAAPLPGPAPAAIAPPADRSEVPIVVIGQRIADRRALAEKRRARNIVDAISTDEVRRLPDITVVDAMRRIPGVSVVPIADNEHPRDVPIAPVVRGLTQAYNNVTINGFQIASTGIPDAASESASRGVRLDMLPTSLVSRLLVIKTFTPDYDPNAIGAAIDLQTRSAFENGGKPFLSIEGGLARPSQRSRVQRQAPLGAQASVTASRSFGPEGRFGLTLSANYQQLQNNSNVHATSDSNFFNYYDRAGNRVTDPAQSNGILVPRQDKYWYNGSDRRHIGGLARIEADLDDLTLSMLAAQYWLRDGYTRNENIIDAARAPVIDQTATSGRFASGSAQVGYRGGVTNSATSVAQFDARWRAGARDLVTLRAGYSRATMHERYDMVKFTAGMNAAGSVVGTSALGFAYDASDLQFSFNLPADRFNDLSLYAGDYWRHRSRNAQAAVGTLQLDWRHGMAEEDQGLGFGAGAALTRSDYAYAYHSLAYATDDRGITLAGTGYISNASLPFNDIGLKLIAIDPEKAWRAFDRNRANIYVTDSAENDKGDSFSHDERIGSGYAMARLAAHGIELLAGARAEQTAIETRGYVVIEETAFERRSTASSYLRILPSLLANYRPAADLRLRAGFSGTIGRPSYESYAPRSSIDFDDESAPGDPDAANVRVVLGNPGIKPRFSDNFDLSLEWTLPRRMDGLISAAFFRKQIRNEIFDATTTGYEHGGILYRNAMVTRPTNATGAHIQGIETSATIGSMGVVAPFLRDVGLAANLTLLDGAITVPMTSGARRTIGRLVGQPDHIGNLSIFYSRGGFELRAAINATGRALRSIAPDLPIQDVYWAPRRQFDVQARYRMRSGVSLILDVANITQERLTSLTGPGAVWLKDSYSVPRIIRASLHWGFGQ